MLFMPFSIVHGKNRAPKIKGKQSAGGDDYGGTPGFFPSPVLLALRL